jgi:alpha-L-arabinofuranosidase
MCNAAGIEPVMTTTGVCPQCQPEDMGDLVDFAHGSADTVWGQKRISLGHPEPYNVTFFEVGWGYCSIRVAAILGETARALTKCSIFSSLATSNTTPCIQNRWQTWSREPPKWEWPTSCFT